MQGNTFTLPIVVPGTLTADVVAHFKHMRELQLVGISAKTDDTTSFILKTARRPTTTSTTPAPLPAARRPFCLTTMTSSKPARRCRGRRSTWSPSTSTAARAATPPT